MQEEVQQKTITLVINATKLTGKELRTALTKFLSYEKNKKDAEKDVIPQGKQSVKDLARQNQGMTNIEINDSNIKDFDRVARKYGIDYAVKKDSTGEKPKYLIFFKAKDSDALMSAFKDYTQISLKKQKKKDSVLEKLAKAKEMIKTIPNKVRNKEIGER